MRRAFVILIFVSILSLAACGSSDTATDTSGEVSESVESSAETATDPDTDSASSESEDTAAVEDTDDAEAITAAEDTDAAEAITEEEAQDIAIADSGLSESEIKYINIWTEKEDDQWLYAVEFGTYDDTEYKYEIDMYTGEIAASYIESH